MIWCHRVGKLLCDRAPASDGILSSLPPAATRTRPGSVLHLHPCKIQDQGRALRHNRIEATWTPPTTSAARAAARVALESWIGESSRRGSRGGGGATGPPRRQQASFVPVSKQFPNVFPLNRHFVGSAPESCLRLARQRAMTS